MLTAKALGLVKANFEKEAKEEAQQESQGVLKALTAVLPPQAAFLKAALSVLGSLPRPVQAVLGLGAMAVTLGASYGVYRAVKKITDWFGVSLPRFENVPYIGAFASLFGSPPRTFDADAEDLASLLSSESLNLTEDGSGQGSFLKSRPPSSLKPTVRYYSPVDNLAPSGLIPTATIGVSGGMRKASPAVAQALEFASKTFGIPLEEVYATALQESSLGTNMAAPTSSARGLFQFIAGTWNQVRKDFPEYAKAYNIGPANGKSLNDDRMDLIKSAVMYGLLRNGNIASLKGVSSGNTTVDSYLAHFLGSSGARRLLAALRSTPDVPVSSAVNSEQYAANRELMQVSKKDTRVLSVRDFVTRIYNKIGVTAANYAQSFTTSPSKQTHAVAALSTTSYTPKSSVAKPSTEAVKVASAQPSGVSQKKERREQSAQSDVPTDILQSLPSSSPTLRPSGPSASYAPVRLANGTTALAPL